MNILIIGDSWGVPNYTDPRGAPPEDHLEYRLKNLGYNVFNHAINGASNQQSMESVNFTTLPEIDWIVWFHTECFRYEFDPSKTHDENLIFESNKLYKYAKLFFSRTKSQLAVIGGQSPIGPKIKNIFYKYIKPDFIIEDWRSEILGEQLPESYTVSNITWQTHNADTTQVQHQLINVHEYILRVMRNSSSFPDNCHPGSLAHDGLTKKLHGVFLRKRLIDDGIKNEICEVCHQNEWLGKKIPLKLHHIDRNVLNNEITNLQLVCLNCYSSL